MASVYRELKYEEADGMKRTYVDTLDDYYEIISRKFDRGRISEEKLDRLVAKLDEWLAMDNVR